MKNLINAFNNKFGAYILIYAPSTVYMVYNKIVAKFNPPNYN